MWLGLVPLSLVCHSEAVVEGSFHLGRIVGAAFGRQYQFALAMNQWENEWRCVWCRN